jgi:hypothetical protein
MTQTYPYEYAAPSGGVDMLTVPTALLAYVNAYFAQAGVALPTNQYFAAGDRTNVPWDCEQVVVTMDGISWGRSKDATQLSSSFGKESSVNAMRHADYTIEIVRCHPTLDNQDGQPLPSAEYEAAAVANWIDAGLLSQALINFVAFPNSALPPGGSTQAGAVGVLGPAGGFVGVNASLTMTLAQLAPPAPGQVT